MRTTMPAWTLSLCLLVGCGAKPTPSDVAPSPPAAPPGATTGDAPPAPAPPVSPVAPPIGPAPVAPPVAPPPVAPPADGAATPPANEERVVARQGVGAQGRSLDNEQGMLATPAKSLFAAKERIVFEAHLPQALQLFAASDPSGKGPQTHEEFMQRVIAENNIQLPKLPPGHTYVFDPKTQQLMVHRPK